ncbi:MAG: hypothetical protein HUK28_03505, partial [Methanobrevibacter sp.]|nr:hypothetical protein [Methanobrevibacter sp.]
ILTAVLTDDNGNIIGSDFDVVGSVNGKSMKFVFNSENKVFETVYTPITLEKLLITGNYTQATNITFIDGFLTVNDE